MPYSDYAATGGKPVELYAFTLGSASWFWTSAEIAVTVAAGAIPGLNGGLATTFTPMAIARGRVVVNDEATSQTLEVTVLRTNAIAQLFNDRRGISGPLVLTIYGWQRDDVGPSPAPTYATLFTGEVQHATFSDTGCVLVCGPFQQRVQRRLLQLLYQPTCNNLLYDARCGLAQAAFTHMLGDPTINGQHLVLGVHDAAVFVNDVATYGRPRLLNGLAITTVDGQSVTSPIIAQDCAAGVVTLLDQLPSAGAYFEGMLVEGCDKTRPTCVQQFNNFANFQGFEFVPTRNPFIGSVVP